MQRISYKTVALVAGVAASTILALPALAATTSNTAGSGWNAQGGQHMMRPGVFGTVASISGDTITVTSMMRPRGSASTTPATSTTYTVDATNAKVTKAGAASSLSAIAVGDRISAQGTVSGQNVTATAIMDGIPGGGAMHKGGPGAMSGFKGDGNPVVGGTVSGVNGSTFSVTNSGSNTYTVDATNATVMVKGATSTISAVLSGDKVLVQGTISGQSVTATAVIDQGQATTGTSKGPAGMLSGIAGFFKKIFSFF
jgi:hypothetical protein